MSKRASKKKSVADDRYGLHEVLDRISIIEKTFDDFVLDNIEVTQRLSLLRRASTISTKLDDLYQAVGRERWK